MTKKMAPAERFFWEHAGYSYIPGKESAAQGKRRCAKILAEAEAWLKQEVADGNASVSWEPDELPWEGDCPAPEEVWVCFITVSNETTSLSGIGDPTPEYRRVVEAELAIEAQESMFEAIARRVRQL